MTNALSLNLWVGWIALVGGVVSGAVIGLFFHREEWVGGYGSFPRRLMRLGHISFFGLGFLNILFALSFPLAQASPVLIWAGRCFVIAVVAMPICCFLTAWKRFFRHLFPIPVFSVLGGLVFILIHWRNP